jgi:hypothetical protein
MIGTAECEGAFLAVSTVLGEPREAIEAALGGEDAWGRVAGLRGPSREERARAVATILARLTVDIDEAVLA